MAIHTRTFESIYELASELAGFPEDATRIKVSYEADTAEPQPAGESKPVETDVGKVPAEPPAFSSTQPEEPGEFEPELD